MASQGGNRTTTEWMENASDHYILWAKDSSHLVVDRLRQIRTIEETYPCSETQLTFYVQNKKSEV